MPQAIQARQHFEQTRAKKVNNAIRQYKAHRDANRCAFFIVRKDNDVSYLQKIRFTEIFGIPCEFPIYGYIETLVSYPVVDVRTGLRSKFLIAIYNEYGQRIDIEGKLSNSAWIELPHCQHVWNSDDFVDAIKTLREFTE